MKIIFPIYFSFFFLVFFVQKTNAQPRSHYGFLSALGRNPPWKTGGAAYNKMKINLTEQPNNGLFEAKMAEKYHLIFEENFEADTINTDKWCISVHNDDRPCDGFFADGFDAKGNPEKPGLNSKNVTVKNGVCSIALTHESNGYCNYSGGELKTFSVLPNHRFKNYSFLPNAYIEMRVQIPFGAGIGSSGWLYSAGYGHYDEIDIWETMGVNNTELQTNYIQEKQNKRGENTNNTLLTHFYNFKNKPQSLEKQWITMGLEWSDTAIIWSVNRKPIRHLSLYKIPPCMLEWVVRDAVGEWFMSQPKDLCTYKPYLTPLPFTFRIGTAYGCIARDCGKGKNQLKYAKLPAELLIDYIKVYQKAGHKACKIEGVDKIKKIKNADNVTFNTDYLRCWYLPDAEYEWSSPDFELKKTEIPNAIGFAPSEKLEINQICSIVCTVRFPSGYVEKIVKTVKIIE